MEQLLLCHDLSCQCLLGRNVKLSRSDGMPKTLRFLVGDNADISIP